MSLVGGAFTVSGLHAVVVGGGSSGTAAAHTGERRVEMHYIGG